MIKVGIHMGGPELAGSKIANMLIASANIAAKVREPDSNESNEGWVNPIFFVPGSISTPQFVDYKLGYFSKKKKGLVVQIAVPQSVADGKDIAEFVGMSLREAVRRAALHFASKGIDFSSQKAGEIISAIEAGFEPRRSSR